MSKIKRKFHILIRTAAAFLLVSVLALTACKSTIRYKEISVSDSPAVCTPFPAAMPTETETTSPAVKGIPLHERPLPEFTAPILNFEGHFVINGCSVSFPYFTGANTAGLNDAILYAFMEFASAMKQNSKINYELAFCERGLVSIWMIAYSSDLISPEKSPAEIKRAAFNYDIYTGKMLRFSDCFGCEYTPAYAEKLSSMLTEKAKSDSIKLISPIRPVPENQIFIFSGKGIVFYYRLYEITSFKDGTPMLTLSYKSLGSLFAAPDSPIGRFLSKN